MQQTILVPQAEFALEACEWNGSFEEELRKG